jgi:hypothetical protein
MTKTKESGVNIDLGNHCSRIAYNWAKQTFINRKDKENYKKLWVDIHKLESDFLKTEINLFNACTI